MAASSLSGEPFGDLGLTTTTDVPSNPTVDKLRRLGAPLSEWRAKAVESYKDGRKKEIASILRAALETQNAAKGLTGEQLTAERCATLHLLAASLLSDSVHEDFDDQSRDKGREELLLQVRRVLDDVDRLEASPTSVAVIEGFLAKGFHALAEHMLHPERGAELERANLLFEAALKVESTSPRGLMGIATVYMRWREWGKALDKLRQVLATCSIDPPTEGVRLQSLKQLRFAMATCFVGLGRYKQAKNALEAVVSIDPQDVEALCGLAAIDMKISEDSIGKSMDFLGFAVQADQNHPVVLCHLANHAFYCGYEEQAEGGQSQHWPEAKRLLLRALAVARSDQVKGEALFQMGRLCHAQGEFAEAYIDYNKCRKLSANHFACLYGLAQVCMQQKKLDEAITVLEHWRKHNLKSEFSEVLKLLTFAYVQKGDMPKQAVACAMEYVEKHKDDVEGWAMHAEAQDQLAAAQPTGASTAPVKGGLDAYEKVAKLLESEGAAAQVDHVSPQMWNNLGTLRGIQGDQSGARQAYDKGIEAAEGRLKIPRLPEGEAKDLHVARLALRFNKAWLAESLDAPSMEEAIHELVKIREEHNWYADAILQLGSRQKRMGQFDEAAKTFGEASKQSPVLAALAQAAVYRAQGNYQKALQHAESAVQRAGKTQFHYAHVYLGNLYFDSAHTLKATEKERDRNLCKALWNYTKALKLEKDSHYAANGIGMVFAQRGKLDFAKRTFQSVQQHHAMSGDPCVYVNLGHAYLNSGKEGIRKAIALYSRAKKLDPYDLCIRLYIAKAHFLLKEFEHASGILSDSLQLWPDDLLLRYNLAIALENYGVFMVNEEKKTQRVVGVDSGMDHLKRAVDLLASATKLYSYVELRWQKTPKEEQQRLEAGAGAPAGLREEMGRVQLHKEYCNDITQKARDALEDLQTTRIHMDEKMQKISYQRAEEVKKSAEDAKNKQREEDEKLAEMEDEAIRLMNSADDIQLGKNLEAAVEKKPAVVAKPKAQKGPKLAPESSRHKKDKKDKKKKDKKDKKKKKKKDRAGSESDADDVFQDDLPGEDEANPHAEGEGEPSKSPGDGEGGHPEPSASPVGGEEDLFGEDAGSDDGGKKKKKKDKKDKKDKKKEKKKDKKDKKRRRESDDDDEEAADGEASPQKPKLDDADMEEQLFGPGTDSE